MNNRTKPNNKRNQKGVAVIEFALVFTIVFAVFWSMVCYVTPLLVLQRMHSASAEGARVGAMYTIISERELHAKLAALEELKKTPLLWFGVDTYNELITSATCATVDDEGNDYSDGQCLLTITVKVTDFANKAALQPFSLPGIGQIPALPQNLSSTARLMLYN